MHTIDAMKNYLSPEATVCYIVEGKVQKCYGTIESIASICVILESKEIYFQVAVNSKIVFKKDTQFKYWLGPHEDFPKGI